MKRVLLFLWLCGVVVGQDFSSTNHYYMQVTKKDAGDEVDCAEQENGGVPGPVSYWNGSSWTSVGSPYLVGVGSSGTWLKITYTGGARQMKGYSRSSRTVTSNSYTPSRAQQMSCQIDEYASGDYWVTFTSQPAGPVQRIILLALRELT